MKSPIMIRSQRCPFCNNKKCFTDVFGHHFASACMTDFPSWNGINQKSQPHAIHDHLRHVLAMCAKHAMTQSVQEPKHLLEKVVPDIVVTTVDSNFTTTTTAVDLSLVTVFKGAKKGELSLPYHSTNSQGILPDDLHDKRAKEREREKISKYQAECAKKGIKFVPFIINTTGKINKKGYQFLQMLANHASEVRNIPASVLLNFYLKMISICLTKQIARTIYSKGFACISGNHINPRRAFRERNMRDLAIGDSHLFNSVDRRKE